MGLSFNDVVQREVDGSPVRGPLVSGLDVRGPVDISQLRNPYDFRNPVRDAAFFAGRSQEVADIRYELAQAGVGRPSVCVALHGQRAAGKTSLLNAAERMARELGIVPVRVELIEGDGEPTVFFRKVYEEIVATVADVVALRGDTVPFDVMSVRRAMAGAITTGLDSVLQFPEAVALAERGDGRLPEAALRVDLTRMVRLLGQPLALLIDEAQLAAGDARVLSVLRFLTTRVDGLVLVLAGTSGLIDQIRDVHSQILRQFKEIEVQRFVEHQDVYDCVIRPLQAIRLTGASPGRGVVSELMRLTDGNPYEVQLYCHEMFARFQRGETSAMELTSEVLEAIRSRLEAGRDLMARPLIRAVRAMDSKALIAFNVLTSGLGQVTANQAWFAYSVDGKQKITREEYEQCHRELVARGILAADDVISFAIDAELLDEIYVRLWTAGRLKLAPHAQLTGRTSFRGLVVDGLLGLMHELAGDGPLRIFRTCCSTMGAKDVERSFSALESLPEDGPDVSPTIDFVHRAVLQAGEPGALDVTSVVCRYGELSVERWVTAADTEDIVLADLPGFAQAAARVEELGGELKADRVRVPLRTWPAEEWFVKATGRLRGDLADNHEDAAYDAYRVADLESALRHFRWAFELAPTWGYANCVAYVALASGLSGLALEWSRKALDIASGPGDRALSLYNAAVANLLGGEREESAALLDQALLEIESFEAGPLEIGFLQLPNGDDPATLHEETDVDLRAAVCRVQSLLGLPAAGGSQMRDESGQGAPATDAGDGGTGTGVTRPGKAPVVLAVATEWASSHGGLSTFNRELCCGLAAAGASVYCIVLAATADEVTSAEAAGVKLLPAGPMAGGSDDLRLAGRPDLPPGTTPDLIVGHSRITGSSAKSLADNFFPEARRLHFVHMAPDEIEWLKPGRETDAGLRATERTGIERALGTSAYRVVAVGPRLHDQFQAEFTSAPRPPLRLDPGFDVPAGHDSPRTPPGGSPYRVLLLGRTEDAEIKGVGLAAASCGRVDGWLKADGEPRVRLVVRGAPPGSGEQQRAQITTFSGNPDLQVVVREYTADEEEIVHDLDGASLLLMPSRTEGFGLVGVEAIDHGVPVLISSESGLGQLLWEELGQRVATRFVIPVTGRPEQDTDAWARAVERVLRDREGAFRRAAELRAALAQKVTWAAAAAKVLAEAADREDLGSGGSRTR